MLTGSIYLEGGNDVIKSGTVLPSVEFLGIIESGSVFLVPSSKHFDMHHLDRKITSSSKMYEVMMLTCIIIIKETCLCVPSILLYLSQRIATSKIVELEMEGLKQSIIYNMAKGICTSHQAEGFGFFLVACFVRTPRWMGVATSVSEGGKGEKYETFLNLMFTY